MGTSSPLSIVIVSLPFPPASLSRSRSLTWGGRGRSKANILAVALRHCVFLWNAGTGARALGSAAPTSEFAIQLRAARAERRGSAAAFRFAGPTQSRPPRGPRQARLRSCWSCRRGTGRRPTSSRPWRGGTSPAATPSPSAPTPPRSRWAIRAPGPARPAGTPSPRIIRTHSPRCHTPHARTCKVQAATRSPPPPPPPHRRPVASRAVRPAGAAGAAGLPAAAAAERGGGRRF